MSKQVEISKINIKIGTKEIPLTLSEAQELQQILNDTFGKTVVIPSSPIVIERPVYPYPRRYWEVTWGTDTGSLTYSLMAGNGSSIQSRG